MEKKAKHDQALHRVRCNFKRVPGHTYHLYVKENNSRYFSMLSPADWHGKPPDRYIGPFCLEADMSWTSAEERQEAKLFNEMLSDYLKKGGDR